MLRNKIAYVGGFRFPKGEAASVRVFGLGKIFAECGFQVTFHGITFEKDADIFQSSGIYKGFSYFNLINKRSNILLRLLDFLFAGYRLIKILDNSRPDYIVVYGSSSRYLVPILLYARRNNIKVIADVVEWYNYSHLPGGRYNFVALDVHLALTFFIKKCDGVIAISSFLESYYRKSGLPTIRIPIVIDNNERRRKFDDVKGFEAGYLNLLYAGVPGKKDQLAIVVYALDELVREGYINIRLHLVGPTRREIILLLNGELVDLATLKDNIIFYGRVDQDEIPPLLSKADFSLIVRSNERYANAGFPTKFVESMTNGLPVIANITSDLGLYLKDGENGFVMADNSVKSLKDCLVKASLLSDSQKKMMREKSRLVAIDSFDFLRYVDSMRFFMQQLFSN